MNRGSEFKKWDLHVHSLYSRLNNNFKYISEKQEENWEHYLKILQKNEISAIGLTNYFNFDDNDFKLKDYLEEHGITTFLNLEIRLSNINKNDDLFDYHIIFNNKLDHKMITNILGSLSANVGDADVPFNLLTNYQIEHSASIDFDKLNHTLSDASYLKGQYLKGFLSRGHGSATSDRDPKNRAVYENICRKSDFVIHSSCDDPNTCVDPNCHHNNLETDRNFWLNNPSYIKPLLQSSDAHSFEQIGTKYSWIKSDTTFIGLKQILFEPEDRVSLKKTLPRLEKDELVIDNISYDNKTIPLSEGLNSIIGGRGNGKSTLLNSIAKKLGQELSDKNSNYLEQDKFTVTWRDNTTNDNRDIEYIGQDFMFEISNNPNKLNEIIQNIIASKNLNTKIQNYENECNKIKTTIQTLLADYFNNLTAQELLQKPEGEKEAAETRLKNYLEKRETILGENNLSDSDKELLQQKITKKDDLQSELEDISTQLKVLDNIEIENLKINFNNPEISSEILNQVKELENNINKDAKKHIDSKILDIKTIFQTNLSNKRSQIDTIENDELFKKGRNISQNNNELSSLDKLIEKSRQEIETIQSYEKKKNDINETINNKRKEIIETYKKYETIRSDLSETVIANEEGLTIQISFTQTDLYKEFTYINGQGNSKDLFIQKLTDNFSEQIDTIFTTTELKFNSNYSQKDLINHFFSTNFYEYNYNILYQDDEFQQMSPGKKSFVILKLILEFSDSKVPVLIDQPEDSLDNRSIYNQLTQYLRKTKKMRQIIVVTHNPNVVIGADSENIIIANKNSVQYPNEKNRKFDYINGSLESENAIQNSYFLQSNSIKSHIFDILEGGQEAFKKRENKYNGINK